LKLRQLEALRAVIAAGTTTHAAETMRLTQSAVSRLISELERETDIRLFERRHGRLALTSEGELFYSEAERVLAGMDHMATTVDDIRSLRAGSLRIIAMPALAFGLVPEAIGFFDDSHPNVRISVNVISQRREIEESLARLPYDLALVTLPMSGEDLCVEPLFAMNAVCVMPPGHRLAERDVVDITDLKGETFISVDPKTRLRNRIDNLFATHGVHRNMRIETETTIMVCHIVADGVGVSIVHPFVASALANRVVAKPFTPAIRFNYGLIFPELRERSRLCALFADVIRDKANRFRDNAL